MGLVAAFDRVLKPTPVYTAIQAFYRHCFRREFLRERRRMMDFYAPFVPSGGVCFDVGANYGSRCDVFLGLGARVIAVEPVPMLARALRDRFRHRPGRIEVIEAALGAQEGRATLHIASINKGATLSPDWIEDCARTSHLTKIKFTPAQTAVTTLDALVARFGPPCFVKIDVEGFEREVLRGLSTPVPALSFEYAPWRASRAEECVRQLAPLGPWRFNSSRAETLIFRHERWLTEDQVLDFCREQLPAEPEYGDFYAVHQSAADRLIGART